MYDQLVAANIADNKKHMDALGLGNDMIPLTQVSTQVSTQLSPSNSEDNWQPQVPSSSDEDPEVPTRAVINEPKGHKGPTTPDLSSQGRQSNLLSTRGAPLDKFTSSDEEAGDFLDQTDGQTAADAEMLEARAAWAVAGVVVGPDELLADSVVGVGAGAGNQMKVFSVGEQRRNFLLTESIADPGTLKDRASMLGLNINKTIKDKSDGSVKKIFFYPAGVKGKKRHQINFIRFARRTLGLYTLSSVHSVNKVLEMWAELIPPQSKAVQELAARRPVKYTPSAVRTAIQMLTGKTTQSTYQQVADRGGGGGGAEHTP